jgi:Kef-type K+ transport system membrane component KefB
LFEVGLESTVREVAQVGRAGSAVALLGTVGSFSAGMVAARIVLVHDSWLVRAFVAASITATSIGISARVLRDLGAARTREALTILGAAVIDDVLGLLVLAIMSGVASGATQGAPVSGLSIVWLLVKTIGVLTLAIVMGVVGSPWLFALTSRFRTEGALVTTGLFFCFVLAWAASTIGLSPIVGAFTAGLVLEESHSARFVARGEPPLSDRMEPIASWLVPIFFVVIGIRADVRALANASTLALVLALGSAAIVGKLACAIGAPRGSDRIAVALGMIPRGEVTLVFANLGLSLPSGGRPLFDANIYSALVAVVVVTTIATPLALRLRLRPARSKVTHP